MVLITMAEVIAKVHVLIVCMLGQVCCFLGLDVHASVTFSVENLIPPMFIRCLL